MADLTMAAFSTADVAIKAGKALIQLCSDYRHANDEIREDVMKIKSVWIRTEKQIDFLSRIWRSLDVQLQRHQDDLLIELASKLENAINQVGRVMRDKKNEDGTNKINRAKYATIKKTIIKAIEELREWQNDFNPGWYLILKIAAPVIDRELATTSKIDGEKAPGDLISTAQNFRKHLNDDPQEKFRLWRDADDTAKQVPIPYSAAKSIQRSGKGGARNYIVDTVPCLPGINVEILTKDVRDLARKLSVADPATFGLLQCRGVVRIYDRGSKIPTAFDFVFQIPLELKNPRSLRSILLAPDARMSLSSRFQVARQLAQSVCYVHTYGFVHKGIRPDTVLILDDTETSLPASFLLGFEKFRTADGRTLLTGDSEWDKDLYRHPQRQGLRPEEEYKMQHDIYSLGICLLEIGIWESFVSFDTKAVPSKVLPGYVGEDKEEYDRSTKVKNFLVELTRKKLPNKMGDKYTEVVVNCLTCLDEDNVDFGDSSELEDEDGVQIGVRYIEKILRKLNNISM